MARGLRLRYSCSAVHRNIHVPLVSADRICAGLKPRGPISAGCAAFSGPAHVLKADPGMTQLPRLLSMASLVTARDETEPLDSGIDV